MRKKKPKQPTEPIIATISFVSKAGRKRCLADPEWVATMQKLINKAYHYKPKKK